MKEHRIHVYCSIGVAIFPEHDRDGRGLLRKADIAMCQAKMQGNGALCIFEPWMDKKYSFERNLPNFLEEALQKNEFFLDYQPLIDANTTQIIGLEALIRWKNQNGQVIGPDLFIPVAEENEMIISIGDWVIQNVCHQLSLWEKNGKKIVSVAINISAKQLRRPEFSIFLERIIKKEGIDSRHLILEITEHSCMDPTECVQENLFHIRKMGIRISLDDFGTGYNTLTSIRQFFVDSLKIDRSFVSGLDEDINKMIVESIVLLGKRMNVQIVAEGVETEEQYQYLKNLGCHIIQGYYFYRPLSEKQASQLLEQTP